jgi:hypothetical protein
MMFCIKAFSFSWTGWSPKSKIRKARHLLYHDSGSYSTHTASARILKEGSPCGIYGGQSGTETGFSLRNSVLFH